jgi:phosphoribosylformylglycinamidine synthase
VRAGSLQGRPTGPNPDIARRVIDLAAELAHQAVVLHDVSDGGLAVTIAEICIASGVGAQVDVADPTILFSEDPHRFVAVIEGNGVELPADLATRIGTISGDRLAFGSYSVELSEVARSWRDALPTALNG